MGSSLQREIQRIQGKKISSNITGKGFMQGRLSRDHYFGRDNVKKKTSPGKTLKKVMKTKWFGEYGKR